MTDRGGRTLAVLAYHKVGPPPPDGWRTWFYVPEDTFSAQLRYLAEHDWTVLDLDWFLRGLADPGVLPDRSALLTFDDGYRSTRAVALPHLTRFGYRAVVFVPTAFVARHNDFDSGVEPREPICEWSELIDLEASGVTVQSHGVTHRTFSALGAAEIEDEIRRSKEVLESGLGRRVETLAFPYGDAGAEPHVVAAMLQAAGYRAAFTFRGGPVPLPVPDAYTITRIAMGPDTDMGLALRTNR